MIRTNAALAACVNEYDEDGAPWAAAANSDAPAVTLASVLEAVEAEADKYRRGTVKTTRTYADARKNFCSWAQARGVVTVSQITVEAMNAYVSTLEGEHKAASTIALYAGHIRRLVLDAAGLGRAASIDGRLLKWLPRRDHGLKPHVRQALTSDEVQQVLATAERQGLRVLAVVHLALCGLRTTEVAGLTVGDVDLEGARVRILGKGRVEPEWIDVPPPTCAVLNAYLQNEFYLDAPDKAPFNDEPLWRAVTAHWVQCILRAVLVDAGCKRPGVCPHSFRHTAATFLLGGGVPLAKAAQYLRHREPKTTMRYAHDLGQRETAAFLSELVSGPVRTGPAKTGKPAIII